MPEEDVSEPPRTGLWPAGLALAAAVTTAGAAALHASSSAALQEAALAAGLVLAVAVIGVAFLLRGPSLPAGTLLSLPTLALLAAAAAGAGATALPDDLHLRSIGRPPLFLLPLAAALATALAGAFLVVGRGAPVARAGLVLLLPLLTLEGLPIGAPPGLGLAAAGVVLLLAAARKPAPAPGLLAIAAFLVAIAASTFLGADPGPGVDVLTRLLALAGAFLVLATDEDPKAAARLAIRTLLATVSLVTVAGLVSRGLLHEAVRELGIDAFGTELSLFGRHPNTLAPWFGAGAVLALPLALHGRGLDRGLAAVTLPLATVALLLTASRLSIAATLLSVVLISIGRTRLLRALLRAGVAVAVVLVAALLLPAFRDKIQNRENHPNIVAESHRLHRMEVAWRTAMERPWIGHGPRTWFVQGRFVPPSRFDGENSADHPHDLPLALLEGSGAVGLLLFLLVLGVAVGRARRALRSEDAEVRLLATGVTFALVAQLATNLLDMGDALETFVPSRLFIDLGLLAALARAAGDGAGLRPPRLMLGTAGVAMTALGTLSIVGLAFAKQGGTLSARGEAPRAIAAFERAATLRPFDADVHMQLAGAAFLGRRLRVARESLRAAEELAPERPSLHEARAQLLRALGDDRAALRAIEHAHALDPRGATGSRLAPFLAELRCATGDRAGGLAAAAAALWTSPAAADRWIDLDTPDTLFIGGVPLPVDEVVATLATRVEEGAAHRRRRRVPLREAELYLKLARYDDAFAALERLGQLDGEVGVHQLQFEARTARAAGELDRSRRAAQRALADRPHPSLEIELGRTLSAAGDHEGALAAYHRALALSLDAHFVEGIYHEVLTLLTDALTELGRDEERAGAIEQLVFFTSDDLDRAATLVALADAHAALGAADDADADLRRALSLVLTVPASERSLALATDLGERHAAAAADAPSPSRAADALERFAERRGGGAVLHTFRVALLAGLGLDERARAARRERDATR